MYMYLVKIDVIFAACFFAKQKHGNFLKVLQFKDCNNKLQTIQVPILFLSSD